MKDSTVEQRFWSKVQKTDGCWLWIGARFRGRKGQLRYGMFAVNRYPVRAHRFSYELHYGPIPESVKVLHRCDNERCVRPDHLWLGNQLENIQDMVDKGRQGEGGKGHTHASHFGEKSPIAKLTDTDVLTIRRSNSSQRDLADAYGVGRTTIRHILERKTWKHL